MSPEEAARRAAVAAAEKARYEQLKVEFQAWCIGLGLLGTVACYFLYSKDVAISYALGASSGLTYLRLLSRTVDSGEGQWGTDGCLLLVPQEDGLDCTNNSMGLDYQLLASTLLACCCKLLMDYLGPRGSA
jgi:hypothetical protein